MSDPISELNSGLRGLYRLTREIGEGGMATVYLADDVRHGRQVAIKVLRADISKQIGTERFQQEIRITAGLHHPHILPLHDSGSAAGRLFYVMPHVDGESLKERLAREGELPVEEAAQILRDVVDALSAAHAAGVVHRDIKPANILLKDRHAFVADFGVAKAIRAAKAGEQLTTVGTSLGTPAYMSPEQAAGDEDIDHRSDIYAVGAVAYELLTGRPPFTASTHRGVLMAHVTQTPDPVRMHRASVPPGFADAIMKCLEKKRADRWQAVDELLPYLAAASIPHDGTAPSAKPTPESRRRWTSRPGILLGVGLLVASVTVLVGGDGIRTAMQSWLDGATQAPAGEARETSTASPEGLDTDGPYVLAVARPANETGDPRFDYLAARLEDEMRRDVALRAPELELLASTSGGAAAAEGDDEASPLPALSAAGASHVLASRYTLEAEALSVRLEIQDTRSGQSLRVLDPVVGPEGSLDSLIAAVGDRAAVVGIVLSSVRGDGPYLLRYESLPPSVVVAERMRDGSRAVGQGRRDDAIDLFQQARAEAPDFPGVYSPLLAQLANSSRHQESEVVMAAAREVYPRMTRVEQLYAQEYLGMLPTLGARYAARQELYELVGGARGSAWGFAFLAVQVNELSEARDALREHFRDPDAPNLQGFPQQWLFKGQVHHLLGEHRAELETMEEAVERLGEHRAFSAARVFALVALDSVDAALADEGLDPVDPHFRWHVTHVAGLELRRHGHPELARQLLAELPPIVEAHPEAFEPGNIDFGMAYYETGRYEEAVPHLRAVLELDDEFWIPAAALLVISLEALGRDDEARAAEREMEAYEPPVEPSAPLRERVDFDRARRWAALVPASRGDAAGTVRALREAFEDGAPYYQYLEAIMGGGFFLHVRPELDRVADDPTYQALVRPR